MAQRNTTLSDQELIARHIEPNPHRAGIDEARLVDYGVSVWALIGNLPAVDNDPVRLARSYDVPLEAVEAALAFYRRHTCVIDARIAANDPAADGAF